ncbi:putative GntR family transcriptional regulator [Rhodococcus sp. AW25M09]|uniref:GntR family transcriptional regulator n=1 Tax=Rhodococcus sp. AW25M09 TaxID=1268303 RepID=UPI0002AC932E|nr:GntR family transcriptional regulator [Rhodococcus sp. AW25M09]CCQ14642.1 putative GntR family transcriptional regulator [Rhodococcus sp. AW25M09]
MSIDLPRKASPRGPIPRRPPLSEDVAGSIRQQIVTGVLQPGTFVRIDETAAELGVSATPVREALVALRGEGLVEQVPHRGYRVDELSPQDIDDIFWLQGTIAGALAGRAARTITPEQIEQLTALNDGLRDAVARADTESVELYEFEFHRFVNRVAGGRTLAWFLLGAVKYIPRLYATDRRWGEDAVRSHEELIAAFTRGDVEAADDVMRRQFRKWDIS